MSSTPRHGSPNRSRMSSSTWDADKGWLLFDMAIHLKTRSSTAAKKNWSRDHKKRFFFRISIFGPIPLLEEKSQSALTMYPINCSHLLFPLEAYWVVHWWSLLRGDYGISSRLILNVRPRFFLASGGVEVVHKKLAGWDHRLRFTEENRIIFGGWVKRLAGPPSPRGGGGQTLKRSLSRTAHLHCWQWLCLSLGRPRLLSFSFSWYVIGK